ncbi:MAG TPA: GIY-YIG nuclease family protein [Geobacterales bacterium]|nr:GIY-YIG nuclease family protein [Geobacterales bacterium]
MTPLGPWHVYIILCSDDTLYTGITTDVTKRFRQHAEGRGAKYFRGRTPHKLIYQEDGHDRSSASQREREIKSLSQQQKWQLARSASNTTFSWPVAMTSCIESP